VLADITFVTPIGAVLAAAVVPPVVAAAVSASQNARGRTLLRLPPPRSRSRATVLAVAAVPLLLGLAAAGPALRKHVGRKIRTDAQAMFVFDTSRSMAASSGYGAPTRFAQAQSAGIRLRRAIADVPSGVASFTTVLIPHLFATADEAAFNTTVDEAIGVEKPPPPFFRFGVSGTSFGPIAGLRDQGYFNPRIEHRFAVVLTDGESGPFDPNALNQSLTGTQRLAAFPGRPIFAPEAAVSLLVVRVGTPDDRIYRGPQSIEAAYRPNPRADANAESLAGATHGRAFAVTDLSAASAALRQLVGPERGARQGVRTKTITLAPYVVLFAFLPLGLVIRRRNLAKL
jgi:hypothetical protein